MPKCWRHWDSTEFRQLPGGDSFLKQFPSTIVVDLTPEVDECYALGPYTLFQGNNRFRARWGDLLYRAKYASDGQATEQIGRYLQEFVTLHPSSAFRRVNAIVSAPKSDPTTPDLLSDWAQKISKECGWRRLDTYKTRKTEPQKSFTASVSEADLISNVADSIGVQGVTSGDKLLVLDDTIHSGGTLREIGRALKQSGAALVCGLSVAKDAHLTRATLGFLDKEWWLE